MAKIKVKREIFDKGLEKIRKASQKAALDYLKLIQKEFIDESKSLGKSMLGVIDDTNAFSYLPNRDIILSGDLRKSQNVTYRRFQAAYQWPTRNPENGYYYSKAVYHGCRPWGTGSFIPGRKYPELALKRKGRLRLVMKVEDGNKGIVAYIAAKLDEY